MSNFKIAMATFGVKFLDTIFIQVQLEKLFDTNYDFIVTMATVPNLCFIAFMHTAITPYQRNI